MRFLESLRNTAGELDSYEVIINIDNFPERHIYRGNDLIAVYDSPKERLISRIYEQCLKHATGDWIWYINDDVISRTSGWDIIARESIRNYPDQVVLFWPNDKIFQEHLACFSLVSRKVLHLADKLFPMPFERYKIDDSIMDIFPISRRIYLPDIVMEHLNLVSHGPGYPVGNKFYPNDVPALMRDDILYRNLKPLRDSIRGRLEQELTA